MKKKLLAVLLTTVMVISMAACGAKETDAPKQEADETVAEVEEKTETESEAESTEDITLRVAWQGNSDKKNYWIKFFAQFTEKTGYKVETIFVPGNWAEYATKVQTMVAGGDRLDVINVAVEGFEMFYDSGLVAPIDDWIAENQETYDEIVNDTPELLRQSVIHDGQVYGCLYNYNNVVVHMNTKRLAEAGLEVPDANWTKEDFLAYCDKLTTEKDGVKQYALCIENAYFTLEGWLGAFGASYMNDDFTKSTFNSPEAVECMQFLQDLIHKYGYSPIPEDSINEIQYLVDGTSAMGFWGRWPVTTYMTNNFEDVAIQHFPAFSENRSYIYGTGAVFVMKDSPYLDAATELAAFVSSIEFGDGFVGTNGIPVRQSIVESNSASIGFPENYEVFYEGVDELNYKPVSAPVQFYECNDVVYRAASEILTNNADVQSTLDAAAAEMDLILAANAK